MNELMKIIYLELFKSNNVTNYIVKMKWGGDEGNIEGKLQFKDMAYILQI